MFRLAYIVTHPIQYQAPLLRLLARNGIALKVFFLSDFSLHEHYEHDFSQTFKWDVPLTDGYAWEILPRWGIGASTPLHPHWPVQGLKRRLRDGCFDAVWIHGWGHVGLRQAVRAAHALGLPVLLRGDSTPGSPVTRGLRERLGDVWHRRLFEHVAGFLCIGSLNRQFYRQLGAQDDRLFYMPYAVDNDGFQQSCRKAREYREKFRAELRLARGRAVVLFAARFIPIKAPQDLLNAYLDLRHHWKNRNTGTPPYLLFVGDGPLRSELENRSKELAGDDVRFLGFRNQSEMPALYDLCDVFVLPSHYEPWGLVVNEVMNAVKPVIVSDRVGAAPDLVRSGANGWVYPHGDIKALSNILYNALKSPAALKEMGRNSLRIIERWNFEADRKGLLQALDSVCDKRAATS